MAKFKDGSRVTGNLRVDGTILDLNGETGTSGQVLSAVQTGDNEVKITASDGAVDDLFGNAVEIGSNKIVIGAKADNNSNGTDAGAVYVYDLDGTNQTKITASDGAANDEFGYSVAVGHNKIVVGAIGDDDNGSASGSVYVYDLDGSNEVKITASDGASNDNFGAEVAIGHNKIVVGADGDASDRGAVYVYNLDGTGETKITASDGAANDIFGISVAIGSNKIVVGAAQDGSNVGAAYVYDLDGTNEIKITASDGAADDFFAYSVAVGSGKILISSDSDDDNGSASGSVYVYDLDGTNQTKITASDGAAGDLFGISVAMGNNKLIVGATNEDDPSNSGAVYVYDLDGTNEVKIKASDGQDSDFLGISVAAGESKIVAGAYGDDDNGSQSGSAYVYDLAGTGWIDNSGGGGGGDITYVTGSTSQTSSISISSIQSGDLVLLFGATDSGDMSGTDPSGWTELTTNNTASQPDNDNTPDSTAYYKFTTSTSESVTGLTDPNSGAVYVMMAFRGVDSTSPFNATTQETTGGTGNPDSPSITTDADGCMIVSVGFLDDDDSASSTTAPSGYTLGPTEDTGADNGSGATLMTAYNLQTSAGAENPGGFSSSGNDAWKAYTIALNPSGDGGGGTGISNYIKCAGTGTVSILSTDATDTWISPSWINTTPVFSSGTWTVSATSITVPNTGVYLVNVNIELSTPDTNGRYGPEVEITVNGTRVGYRASHSYMRGSQGHQESSSNQSTILNLSASDTVGINWRPTCTGRGNTINMEETSSFIEIVQIV